MNTNFNLSQKLQAVHPRKLGKPIDLLGAPHSPDKHEWLVIQHPICAVTPKEVVTSRGVHLAEPIWKHIRPSTHEL